jgi:hypothetical protein
MIEAFLVSIPLHLADQQKLEALVRKIPRSLVREITQNGSIQRTYLFPAKSDLGFKIQCEAIHYRQSELPSSSSCKLTLLQDVDSRYDEQTITIKDRSTVESLFKAMSYGQTLKTFYSLERVHGVNRTGQYQDHFRFSFFCKEESCQLNLSTKPADNN